MPHESPIIADVVPYMRKPLFAELPQAIPDFCDEACQNHGVDVVAFRSVVDVHKYDGIPVVILARNDRNCLDAEASNFLP